MQVRHGRTEVDPTAVHAPIELATAFAADNPNRARQLYKHVVDSFPQDELSIYAENALQKLK